MNEWFIVIDMPTDQPWSYRVSEDRLMSVLEALATLGKTIIEVRPIGAPA